MGCPEGMMATHEGCKNQLPEVCPPGLMATAQGCVNKPSSGNTNYRRGGGVRKMARGGMGRGRSAAPRRMDRGGTGVPQMPYRKANPPMVNPCGPGGIQRTGPSGQTNCVYGRGGRTRPRPSNGKMRRGGRPMRRGGRSILRRGGR